MISEKRLQGAIQQAARLTGWMYYHTHRSDRSPPGFPDCVLVRGNRLIFAELKSAKGRLTPPQKGWLEALKATGAEVYVWRPSDWLDGTVDGVLGK